MKEFDYKCFKKGKIKNIAIFDGGPRDKRFSKTTFMVDNFIKGAQSAGANVEYFKLKNYDIHHCIGCFTCFSKTPGKCIYNDSMTMLRKKYRDADLVVFATPLYMLNMTGILKNFIDRLLPLVTPSRSSDDKIDFQSPNSYFDRYPDKGEQGFIVFCAGGFSEIDGNFDPLISMFRCWDAHHENMYLMGEFYMTSSEFLTYPILQNRKDNVAKACFNSGFDVVSLGKISKHDMKTVRTFTMTKRNYKYYNQKFWEKLKNGLSYLKSIPKIKH